MRLGLGNQLSLFRRIGFQPRRVGELVRRRAAGCREDCAGQAVEEPLRTGIAGDRVDQSQVCVGVGLIFAGLQLLMPHWLGASESIDPTPMAAGTIAEVHRATLTDGERVVVKVQRPTIAMLVRKDLAAMSWIAPSLVGRIPISALANPPALVELFAETM